jgi:hypothetical protein
MGSARYSIEYSHIYTDDTVGREHSDSIRQLAAIKQELGLQSHPQSYSLVVLIDNYNPTTHILDPADVPDLLEQSGARPDYVGLESELAHYGPILLADLTQPRLERSYSSYIASRGKSPCSFLVAIWYLMRFGVYTPSREHQVYSKTSLRAVPFVADQLINILPLRYQSIEDRAVALIAATPYAHLTDRISSRYYETSSQVLHADIF